MAAVRLFSLRDQLRYEFLMKLFGGRLDLAELETRYGPGTARKLNLEIAFFRAVGALHRKGKTLILTDEGYYVWVVLMREFFASLNRLRAASRAAGE